MKNNETGINNLLDEESKELVIWMLTELGKRIDEHNDNFNKELIKTQSKIKNSIAEKKKKHTVEEMNSGLSDSEELISDLNDIE